MAASITYPNISEGIFIRRPNRFIAEVEINNRVEICHVKNTGRCKELLVTGARVYVNQSDNNKRSTKYDLISVWKGSRLINMDSQAPNLVFMEFLRQDSFVEGITLIKPEAKFGGSRFDFYVEAGIRKIFIEVKGVTLEENNVAMFPDAPTERGVKHLNELANCVTEGYEACVVFVVQMQDVDYFIPNHKTYPEFGGTLAAVMTAGVGVMAFDCIITESTMEINGSIPIKI